MAKYEKSVIGDFGQIVNQLENHIMRDAMSMNLVDASDFSSGDINIAVRVYDKYYMRIESRASLSLTVVSHDNHVFISAIGAGGGRGIYFNFDYGAEADMVSIVQRSVEGMIEHGNQDNN
ncbi:MAG TPA: hypothetical protein GX705_07940 [Clostridiales bacterium]|nr:hypothetical protein [Clostridiales bacterium]